MQKWTVTGFYRFPVSQHSLESLPPALFWVLAATRRLGVVAGVLKGPFFKPIKTPAVISKSTRKRAHQPVLLLVPRTPCSRRFNSEIQRIATRPGKSPV